MTWGYHLIVDAARCRPCALRSKVAITRFSKTLVDKINMKAFGAPQVVLFGDGNKRGYTLVQLIETSNITAHFCESTNDMYLDIFSCKYFDKKDAESVINFFFMPEEMNTIFLKRQAPQLK